MGHFGLVLQKVFLVILQTHLSAAGQKTSLILNMKKLKQLAEPINYIYQQT